MSDIKAKGIFAFTPHEKAPDWVVAEIVVSLKDLIAYANENPEAKSYSDKYGEQLKFSVKRSKQGDSLYIEPNVWKPTGTQSNKAQTTPRQPAAPSTPVADEDGLPF